MRQFRQLLAIDADDQRTCAVVSGGVQCWGFDADWAWPTYKIVRLVAIAFAVVVAELWRATAIVLVILAIRMLYKAINLQRASVAPDGGGDGP